MTSSKLKSWPLLIMLKGCVFQPAFGWHTLCISASYRVHVQIFVTQALHETCLYNFSINGKRKKKFQLVKPDAQISIITTTTIRNLQ